MSILKSAMSVASCVVAAATVMSAQNATRRVMTGPEGEVRHLLLIGTPGDAGTDNQSGVIVLDADKGYSFIKRISYDLRRPECRRPRCRASRSACRCRCSMSRRTAG